MRTVVLAVATALGCGHAFPAPLTCDTFKTRLVEAIHASGDEVATPKDFSILRKDEIPRILYGFDGIVGVKGDLNCALDDSFREFNFKSTIDAKSDEAAAMAVTRAKALFGAAICATEPAAITDCDARAFGLIEHVAKDMTSAARRGEPYPHGDAELYISTETQARVMAFPGELAFKLESNLDRDPPDDK